MTTPQKSWRIRTRVTASAVALLIGSSAALVACGNEPDDNTVAKLLPQNTIGFVSAAISPSNKQKMSLFALQKHFPSKVQTEKADEVRDKLIAELFQDSSLNYETDVKPWLGSEAAFAVLPSYGTDHTPVMVGAVKQTDKAKAQAALDKSKQPATSYRFIDEYIFFVDEKKPDDPNNKKALDDIENLANDDKSSLQNNKRFKDNLNQLHGEHLVIGWVDVPVAAREGIAAAKAEQAKTGSTGSSKLSSTGRSMSGVGYTSGSSSVQPVQSAVDIYSNLYGPNFGQLPGSSLGSSFGALDSLLGSDAQEDVYKEIQESADEIGSFSFELYATSDTLVLEGVTEKEPKDTGEGTDKKIFNSLPNDTLAAITVSDFGKSMQNILDTINKETSNNADYQQFKPMVEKLIGAMGNEAVGFVHNGDPIVGGLVADLKDSAAAQSAIDDIVNKMKPSGLVAVKDFNLPGGKAYELQMQQTTGGGLDYDYNTRQFVPRPGKTTTSGPHIYIGVSNNRLSITNDGAQLTAALAGNGDFGSQALVKKALVDQKMVFGSIFLNIDQTIALAEKKGAKFTGEDGDWVKALDVFGSQNWVDDGHYHSELRLGLK